MDKYTDQDVVNLATKIHHLNQEIEDLQAEIKLRDARLQVERSKNLQLKSKIGHQMMEIQQLKTQETIDIDYEETN